MSRFQGYVGIAATWARDLPPSEPALAPVLRETAKRGLIYVDDGASPRSVAGQIAGSQNLPFAKADFVIDAVPTPVESIAHWRGSRCWRATRHRGRARHRAAGDRSRASPNGRKQSKPAASCWCRSPWWR